MTSPELTSANVLLLGVDASVRGRGADRERALPREGWALQVLVEQLLRDLPRGGAAHSLLQSFVHPQRGVLGQRIFSALSHLLDEELILPRGAGRQAGWIVPECRRPDLDQLWAELEEEEGRAIQRAAQRAEAIRVAWSNTRRN